MGDDWDGDRLRVGPWVPGLGDRHRREPVDVEPQPLRVGSPAGRPPGDGEGPSDHDPVEGGQSSAGGAPGDTEPDPSHGGLETSPLAEVGKAGIATPGRRPIRRGLWAIGVVAAIVGATVIALALRSSTPQPFRQNGATNSIAGVPMTATPPAGRSTPTPTSEVSASHAASNRPSPSPDTQRYGPVGYEAEAASNILTGAASVSSYPGSSGGKVVTNIGRWGPGAKRSGTLSFPDVSAPANGVFTLVLYLVGNADPATQTIVITVSGAAPVSMAIPAGSNCCVAMTVRVTLTKGANTIVLGNPDGQAPSIDRMVVSRP